MRTFKAHFLFRMISFKVQNLKWVWESLKRSSCGRKSLPSLYAMLLTLKYMVQLFLCISILLHLMNFLLGFSLVILLPKVKRFKVWVSTTRAMSWRITRLRTPEAVIDFLWKCYIRFETALLILKVSLLNFLLLKLFLFKIVIQSFLEAFNPMERTISCTVIKLSLCIIGKMLISEEFAIKFLCFTLRDFTP